MKPSSEVDLGPSTSAYSDSEWVTIVKGSWEINIHRDVVPRLVEFLQGLVEADDA